MSYGNASHSARPKGNCGCFLFLIVVGLAAYFLLGNAGQMQPGGGPVGPGGIDQGAPLDPLPSFNEGNRRPEKHPDSDDWDMEEVNSKQPAIDSKNVEPSNKKSTDGDWSMEEVDTDDKTSKPKIQLDISNSANNPEPKSKSTKKGDWELEEVDKN